MHNTERNLEFLNEIYRNVSVAMLSISDVLPSTDEKVIKCEMKKQFELYRDFSDKIKGYMAKKGYEVKDVSKMKKIMMWSAIKMNVAFDGSTSHVATIMIKGTVMGITELTKLLNSYRSQIENEAIKFCEELLAIYEENVENLKKFL